MRVGHYFPLDILSVGGVQVHVYQAVRHLNALGVDTCVISGYRGKAEFEIVSPQEAQNRRFDIVHTHGCFTNGLNELQLPCRRVHTYHGTSVGRILACREVIRSLLSLAIHRSGGIEAAWKERCAGMKAEHCICVSENTAKEVHRFYGIARPKMSVIPSGFFPHSGNTVSRNAQKKALELDPDRPVVLFVGRDADIVKGTSGFLEAIRPLSTQRCQVVMVPGETALQNCNIRATGRLFHSDIEPYYRAADVFVLSSLYEGGHSLSLLEAMSYGCCVVASSIPALREVVTHGRNGLLFQTGSSADLRSKIEYALDHHLLRTELGQSAEKFAFTYHTWSHVAARMKSIYQKVIH